MKSQCIYVVMLILTLNDGYHAAELLQQRQPNLLRPNRTLWLNDALVSGSKNYEEVPLVRPRFKSKQLAGLQWSPGPGTEGSSVQKRHLDWFSSSEDDAQNAEPTDKSFISEFFDEDDEEDGPLKNKGDDDNLRQHHRKKHVKHVDKMLYPLLLAYKLKFFALVPVLMGALTLLVSTTGLAGFFFALFAAAAGLHHRKAAHS